MKIIILRGFAMLHFFPKKNEITGSGWVGGSMCHFERKK